MAEINQLAIPNKVGCINVAALFVKPLMFQRSVS